MCGIVGAVSTRKVAKILVEGLKRLEYRGYDSAGLAVIDQNSNIQLCKKVGKVVVLEDEAKKLAFKGHTGIAHTRWATHGKPTEKNAHPHLSSENIALVHNGIIENYQSLRESLKSEGYNFESDTDTEVIAHIIDKNIKQGSNLLEAVNKTIPLLEGAYGLAVISNKQPETIVVARSGSPLVIGVGIEENFVASDHLALRQVTDKFVYLEEGDIAEITIENYTIYNDSYRHYRTPQKFVVLAHSSPRF